jgi:creatinase
MENIIRIENGEKPTPTFSKGEMSSRQDKLCSLLAKENVDSVLFTSYHNINYYADFLYCSFGRPYGLVVTQNKAVTISANIDGGQPWRRSFGENIIYTDWQRDNYFRAIQGEIPNPKTLGVEYDHINVENLAKLQAAFPDTQIVDISKAVMALRMVKSAEEIAVIKNGARIADIGGAACREAIGAGVPEYEVALHSTGTMVREIASTYPHVELMDTWTWFQSGINTDGAHNPVTSRKITPGDILSLNCFPMISGYYTALERTLFCEHASDRHLELWQVNAKVHRRGLELIKPGVRCCEIAIELNEIYKEHDLLQYRTFGYGHSFGVLSHYFGREAGLELREDIETVLEPNMVISMEPMIMLPEGMAGAGGYREHDILVLGEEAAENITKFPFGPEHNMVGA